MLDAIWAGLDGLGAASAGSDSMNPQQGQIVAVGLAWLAVSGISAIYGFTKVSECNKAKRLRDERYFGGSVAQPRQQQPVRAQRQSKTCRTITPSPFARRKRPMRGRSRRSPMDSDSG